MTTRIVYHSDGYGADFELESVKFEPLSEEQKEKGREFIRLMKRPMSEEGLKRLYMKLRLSSRHSVDDVEINEKMRMAIYVDGMRKFPAFIVRKVMNTPYEFFPTLNELICDCEREENMIESLDRKSVV